MSIGPLMICILTSILGIACLGIAVWRFLAQDDEWKYEVWGAFFMAAFSLVTASFAAGPRLPTQWVWIRVVMLLATIVMIALGLFSLKATVKYLFLEKCPIKERAQNVGLMLALTIVCASIAVFAGREFRQIDEDHIAAIGKR